MHFYTSVARRGSSILTRQIKNGRRVNVKEKFQPTLFIESQTDVGFQSLDGRNLKPRHFASVFEAKEFLKQFEDVSNMKVYGNKNFDYQWVSETFKGEIDFDITQIKRWTIDIETEVSTGFPDIEFPTERIQLITIQDITSKQLYTFGINVYRGNDNPLSDYFEFKDEKTMLEAFIRFWETDHPDIVTGWNNQFFDIPYLIGRINVILGEEASARLSPWGFIDRKDIVIAGRNNINYVIAGVAIIDYMDLYKRFPFPRPQESYRLDYIAEVELGKKKLENPYSTFKEFYEKDPDLFVDYNIRDVELVSELEDKMKLIELIVTMTYQAKCNYNDILSSVKTWHCILHNYLAEHNMYVEVNRQGAGDEGIQGAYVKQPVVGKHEWPISFDAASLYPSIMMTWNMSPETIVSDRKHTFDIDKLINREYTIDEPYSVAANGYMYSKEKRGMFPTIINKLFNERQVNKKKMLEAKQEYEKTGDAELLKVISKYDNYQMSAKILLNSLFGAQANKFFMFFDPRIAEGITTTGQYIIRSAENALNIELNKLFGTENFTYVIYCDTDSLFLTLSPLVKKYYKDKEDSQLIDIIDKICKEKIEPIINKACDNLTSYVNTFEQRIYFKRETISNIGVWTGKKRYAVNVFNNEGVRYAEPKLKIMGLEIIRSSTPAPIRKSLKGALEIFLKSDETTLQSFVKTSEIAFRELSPGEIAFPKGVNNLAKYTDPNKIYTKGCPIHVRGTLLFNSLIKSKNVDKEYQPIGEGEKIRYVYLKTPNTIGEDVIAFKDQIPSAFEIDKYVDYDKMFEKAFIAPLDTIVSSIGWSPRPKASLEGLFDEE